MPVLGILPPCGCPAGLGGGVVPNPGVGEVLEYSQVKESLRHAGSCSFGEAAAGSVSC